MYIDLIGTYFGSLRAMQKNLIIFCNFGVGEYEGVVYGISRRTKYIESYVLQATANGCVWL